MRVGGLFRLAWRESRTARRRLLLYMSSISFGVAALVAIDSFSGNVVASVHEQSRALLGGDIYVSSNAAFPKMVESTLVKTAGPAAVAWQDNFPSMIVNPRTLSTRLVDVRAISRGYPQYGTITSAPASAWNELHDGRNVVVDRGLLVTLQAHVGDSVQLGSQNFRVSGVLVSVPGDLGIAAVVGPRVYFSMKQLDSTKLITTGSRVRYEGVAKLPAGVKPEEFAADQRPIFAKAGIRISTPGRNEERLSETIDQLSDFLALVGLVALLLGGIGVASGVHAFVMRKIDTVAVLRCVGATSWQVLAVYVLQAGVMGLIGAGVGTAAGVAIQMLAPRFLAQFLPVDVSVSLVPSAVITGLMIGVWVALIFALRPLIALRSVSPLQALRRDTDAEVMRRVQYDPLHLVVNVAIAGSLLALGLGRAQTPLRGLAYSGSIALAIAILWLVAVLLTRAARKSARPGLPFPLRQGIAALYRPGNQTRSVTLALGFGVFLIGTLYQVQQNLLHSLTSRLEQSRANLLFFDVQEAMVPGVDSAIALSRSTVVERTPVIRMRIASINGERVRNGASGVRRARWAATREYNSTFRDTITKAERLTRGKWFATTHAPGELPEVSVEESVGRQLGLELGDQVTWDVQGVEVPTRVTSFREVQWANFQTNFFVVFSPDALRDAPKQYVVLIDVSDPRTIPRLQGSVVSRYPTISSIDLTLVRQTLVGVISKVTTAIRFLALFSLGLALPVLFSAVSATRRQRLREGVLLKTLGATRRQIAQIMLSEYALLGALGAVAGVLLSTAGAWALLHFVFKQPFVIAAGPMITVAVAMMVLSVSIGLLTGRDVFAETPMAALREA
jgi:putative ABC transport system permease protein